MTHPAQQTARISGILPISLRAVRTALALTMVLVLELAASTLAQAQTFTVLHGFGGGDDGVAPYAGLIRDAAGNFYGTTYGGGAHTYGTVFKLDQNGKENALYAFTGGTDGGLPYASLVLDKKGNLYGATLYGGKGNCRGGCGTVFKVNKAGEETVLHSFTGGRDGAAPQAGLIRDAAGNLYGTAQIGGKITPNCPSGCGTVFKVTLSNGKWKETVLHTFTNVPDGADPIAGLTTDATGNLYGTTYGGGAYGYGTVFKVSKSGKKTLLHSFRGNPDGRQPYSGLILDKAGNFYGTTGFGGYYEYGTVFKLSKAGQETVLFSFSGMAGDAYWPVAGLARDSAGNLYGATMIGGAFSEGTVYKLDGTGKATVLYSFSGLTDGGNPWAGLIWGPGGHLYGTTTNGGAGGGVAFEITP